MRLRTGRCCAALLVLCICHGTRASEWEAVHKTTNKIWGGKNRHSIRYAVQRWFDELPVRRTEVPFPPPIFSNIGYVVMSGAGTVTVLQCTMISC